MVGVEVDTWGEQGCWDTSAECAAECAAECVAEVEVDRILGGMAFLFLLRKAGLHDALCHWL